MVYNKELILAKDASLWFDVGNEWYTTTLELGLLIQQLWFDVGNEWYTTHMDLHYVDRRLWFDVGNEWYTTIGHNREEFL